MHIEKLPSGSYRIKQRYNGSMYRVTVDHKPSQKEATLLMAELLQDVKAENGTFKKYAEEYIENRKDVLSPASVRTYTTMVNSLISDNFKNTNIYNITQEMVQKEINEYFKTHAAKTTRSLHGFISAVLGANRPSFVLSTTLPQKEAKKPYLPTEDDIRTILDAAKGTGDSIGFQLGVLGLRRGEVCALQMSDLSGNELTISKNLVYNKKWIVKENPKTDASFRTIILPDKLVKEIQEQGSFFDMSPQKLNSHLHDYQKKLGIPQFRFHDLRHYFASYCHSQGICDADIMAMGGWESDYVMKRIYRDAMEENKKTSAIKIANSIL